MKKLITLVTCLFMLTSLIAQTPKSFKYQSIARDNAGVPITNQSVSFRMSIYSGSPSGTLVYRETHNAITNDFGLANLEIGNGTVITGDIAGISWSSTDFYLQAEMDPAGGTAWQNLGSSKLQSVPFSLFDGDWEIINNDDLILSVPGKVGIGGGTFQTKLEVFDNFSLTNTTEDILTIDRATSGMAAPGIGTGLIFRTEVNNGGQALSGRISSVMENVSVPGAASGMRFQTLAPDGSMSDAMYIDPDGKVGIGGYINPMYDLDVSGRFRVAADSPNPIALIDNNYAGNGYGLSAGMYNFSAGEDSYGLFGFNFGSGFGVYGISYNDGIGIQGVHDLSNNFGYIGSSTRAIYGYNAGSGNYGSIGTADNAVFGNLYSYELGDYAIYGYGVKSSGIDGTGYTESTSLGGVKGYNFWGNPYTFAVAGFSFIDYERSGATFGSNENGSTWGSLSYKRTGGAEYGGYFTSYTSGSGKSSDVYINNGIGAYGELFGADIHGKVYGAYIEGENYASFSDGLVFKNNLDVHLQENGTAENTALYTYVSTDAAVQTSGYATLSGGKANIPFDQRFASVVSEDEPIIVTVTPMGNSKGVYLKEVNKNGFSVEENESGKSNVTVSYIAIGKRKGYENPQLPLEVIAADYTSKLEQGLHNDADTETDGAGLYYENGELYVGKHPSTFLDMSKKPEELNNVEKPEKRIFPDNGNGNAANKK